MLGDRFPRRGLHTRTHRAWGGVNSSTRSPPLSPVIPERAVVDLWLASLDGGDMLELKRYLAPDEMARAARFIDSVAARRYVAARGNLRHIIAHYLDCRAGDVRFAYGEFGKPALSGSSAGNLHFNASHAGGLAAYAICATAEVGVDIEHDDGHIDPRELAPSICSADELRQFQMHPASEQRELFFRLWTRKEAYMKCLGCGLSIEPSQLEVPMANVPQVMAGDGDLRCSIRTFNIHSGFQLSVASRSARTEVRRFLWWPTGAPILEQAVLGVPGDHSTTRPGET